MYYKLVHFCLKPTHSDTHHYLIQWLINGVDISVPIAYGNNGMHIIIVDGRLTLTGFMQQK